MGNSKSLPWLFAHNHQHSLILVRAHLCKVRFPEAEREAVAKRLACSPPVSHDTLCSSKLSIGILKALFTGWQVMKTGTKFNFH